MLERDAFGDLLFPIRSAPERYFYAGRLPKGRQVLIALNGDEAIIVAIFDGDGNLMRVVHKELPQPPVLPNSGEIREMDEADFQEYLHREFGFAPDLIRIKEFRIPEEMFAVYHLPQSYQQFIENPDSPSFDAEEREMFPRLIRESHEWGWFVLEWGNDFWLDSTGEVVAS